MELCRTGYTDFQKDMIIEEKLTTSYIPKVSMRNEYLEKFKEYKIAKDEYLKILNKRKTKLIY